MMNKPASTDQHRQPRSEPRSLRIVNIIYLALDVVAASAIGWLTFAFKMKVAEMFPAGEGIELPMLIGAIVAIPAWAYAFFVSMVIAALFVKDRLISRSSVCLLVNSIILLLLLAYLLVFFIICLYPLLDLLLRRGIGNM